MSDAVVLTGAAVKGAFTAGALSVLVDPTVKSRLGINIRRVVGASSGALNAAFFAALLRTGDEVDGGSRLSRIWVDDVTFGNAFSLSLRGIFSGRGIFDTSALLSLMRRRLTARPGTVDITLNMAVTNIEGRLVGAPPMTSNEHVASFSNEDFDAEDSLDIVRQVAAASASIPGLYVPAKLDVDGHSFHAVDGGTVDDTPLATALADHRIRRIFVISPDPLQSTATVLGGVGYAGQIFDILIQQRLVRDLQTARSTNAALAKLVETVPDPATRARVLEALGWSRRRPVEIVEIRPSAPLPGQAFSGLFSRSLREEYVHAGIFAAERATA